MKNVLVHIGLLLVLAGYVAAADIGDSPWVQSNIETFSAMKKADVVNFLNNWGGVVGTPAALTARDVQQFRWMDLAGDGKLQLALISSSGPCCSALVIYWQDTPGNIR